ncbi:MAG: autorepressor SdpR family transcription factor [Thermoflexales bacterium]|nr:autorepressor SdpR family transcription factor [Thermoflexales bacterium]
METALSLTLQALSDPTRREILRRLGEGDLTAGDLASGFDMSAPSVSHHLGVLKRAELVRAERRGQNIVYSLNATVAQETVASVMALLRIGQGSTQEGK